MCRGQMNHTVPVLKGSLESFRRNLKLLLKIKFKKNKKSGVPLDEPKISLED